VKTLFAKITVLLAIAISVCVVYCIWFPHWPFLVAWPGLVFARMGLSYSWIVTVFFVVGSICWLGTWFSKWRWRRVITVSLLLSVVYYSVGLLFAAYIPVPLPKITVYDEAPIQRAAYLKSFRRGYYDGVINDCHTYCFYPEAETKGFYDGSYFGSVLWFRMLGITLPKKLSDYLKTIEQPNHQRIEMTGAQRSVIPIRC
jgi:hypothetical protein